jgi:hypothetical protein
MLAGLTVCTPGRGARVCVASGSGANGGVSWDVSDCTIVARSSLMELRWDALTGALVGLRNVATGTELLTGSTHSAWSAAIANTDDIWSARTGDPDPSHGVGRNGKSSPAPGHVELWSSTSDGTPQLLGGGSTVLSAFAARPLDGGGFTFDLTFAPAPGLPLQVVQHVTLLDGDPVAHWTTDVTASPSTTVVSIASPELLGVATLPGEQLAWPLHEGALFPRAGSDVGTDLRWMSYPAAASMQWMELFTTTEGLYLGVVDSTGSYKELNFGYDPALGLADQPREMAVSFFGYATAQRSYSTPEVEVGMAPTGGWYWGADRYRAFLAKSGMVRKLPKIVRELRGWHRGFNRTYPIATARTYDYCTIPPLLMGPEYTDRTGISVLLLYGWHHDGLDSYYPDYEFLSKSKRVALHDKPCLQGADLAASMQSLAARPEPNRVMFYVNAHIADQQSEWYQDPANRAAQALGPDGTPYVETYPTQPNRFYSVMCPMAQAWADRLDAKAMELRTLAPPGAGAVGIYWDQAEEVPALPCYDRTHGHSTPHSAFPEGYRALFQRINADFSLSGSDDEYIFAAEGANDYYSQFIDVAGGMPLRPPGFYLDSPQCDAPTSRYWSFYGVNWPCDAKHAPEIGRYTMSARFLGLANFKSKFGARDEYARAFLLGDAFRQMEVGYRGKTDPYGTINAFAFPRYTNIYASEPEIYFYGTYVDAKGLVLDAAPTDVMATLIVGVNGDRIGVQLWNQTSTDRLVRVEIHLDVLGLPSGSTGVVDLDGGAAPSVTVDGPIVTFVAAVPSNDVKAYKVAL